MGGDEAGGEVIAVGVDGCRSGWIAAIARRSPDGRERSEVRRFADFEELLGWHEAAGGRAVVAVDVPIGLPPEVGPRSCDQEARGLPRTPLGVRLRAA